MDGGVVYQLWPAAPELHITNKSTVVNHGLETKAEWTNWLFECLEISKEDNKRLSDCEHQDLSIEIIQFFFFFLFDGCDVMKVGKKIFPILVQWWWLI